MASQTFGRLAAVCLMFIGAFGQFAQAKPGDVIENSIGLQLVEIPPGEFNMGSPQSERGRYSDEDLHRVRISRPFYLGRHEVTVGQFQQFVNQTGYKTFAETSKRGGSGYVVAENRFAEGRQYSWRNPGFPQGADHPVVNVTWYDAYAFCQWLSRVEQAVYRLPTEAEWEYACRAGTETAYHVGNDEEALTRVANVSDRTAAETLFVSWGVESRDGFVFTSPVGKFQANAFGLYDMHGNAWEWCEDWYDDYAGDAIDPHGPPDGTLRVVRGGGWFFRPSLCRSADRSHNNPLARINFYGFRVARNP